MPHRLSRRDFLGAAATAGALSFHSGRLSGAEKPAGPNERLRVAVVGVTNQGRYNLDNVANAGAEIAALCDVDENIVGDLRKKYPNATFTTDYRRLFDAKGFDAAVVATPDHHHALATLRALHAGLHVYCEKPLTHTVQEARAVAELAARQKRVTQMGTQIHAGDNYRRVVELVQRGAIGPVREVHVWCSRAWSGGERPAGSDPIPAGLHWDNWLGPAPQRPFHHGAKPGENGTYHRFNWRKWWDFGGGSLADMACHYVDLPFWALDLRHPTKVAAEGPPPHAEIAAAWLIVRYEFPARGERPPVQLTWYDGGKKPSLPDVKLPDWGNAVLFVGEKGMLISDYGRRQLLPEDKYRGFEAPKPTIATSVGHHKEWVEACKHGGKTTCNFDYSGALTEAVLLGNVSHRLGNKPLEWDAKSLRVTNEPEAERFVKKEYRKGWGLA